MSKTRLFRIYADMKTRCYNTKRPAYELYGLRGIGMCDEWLNKGGFEKFYEWCMNNGYSKDLTIDRINNDKGYSPENCRWTTCKEQCNNRRGNLNIEYNNETKTLAEWCDFLNMPYHAVYHRLYEKGLSVEESFTKSIGNQGRRQPHPLPYNPA
jgi:hypothetical protein